MAAAVAAERCSAAEAVEQRQQGKGQEMLSAHLDVQPLDHHRPFLAHPPRPADGLVLECRVEGGLQRGGQVADEHSPTVRPKEGQGGEGGRRCRPLHPPLQQAVLHL